MITLNIISPELKKEIKLKNIYLILKVEIFFAMIFIIFYLVAIISSKYILKSYLTEISLKNNTTNEATNETIETVDNINKKLVEVAKIQTENINWLNLLEIISNNTESDVKYNKITMDTKNGLTLSGISKTREGLIKIKNFLENAPYLSDVNFPISNLLEKKDINFNITAKFKTYDFK